MKARAILLAWATCLALAPTASARGLTLGFSVGTSAPWMQRAAEDGAGLFRADLKWRDVAPAIPSTGFHPRDPASSGYDWSATDALVRNAAANHLAVLLTIRDAPTWAEGPHRPRSAPAGTWRPSPRKLAAFATAAARRYSGSYPDPARSGRSLPRVTRWQVWNEPNLSNYLTPQWTRNHGHYVAASPAWYRRMLNATYTALKGVSRRNFVLSAGTAPYGDLHPGGQRIPPVAFMRSLLCLHGRRALSPVRCHDPAHLDGIDHHPYGVAGPHRHALNADDVAVPDTQKLVRVLRAAERHHRVLPRGHKQVWVTEISWDSRPPDPDGVPARRQARWLEDALNVLWHDGVGTVLWLQVVDDPPRPSYASTYQGGIYYRDGRAKPAAQAFRFPFVVSRARHSGVRAWGRAPEPGRLVIERRRPGGWRVVKRIRVHRHQVFSASVRGRVPATYRARVRAQTSLPWHGG